MSNPPIADVKSALTVLFNAALAAQGITADFTGEDLTFGQPVLYAPLVVDTQNAAARNTYVPVTVELDGKVVGYNLHYNRFQLAKLFAETDGTIADDGELEIAPQS